MGVQNEEVIDEADIDVMFADDADEAPLESASDTSDDGGTTDDEAVPATSSEDTDEETDDDDDLGIPTVNDDDAADDDSADEVFTAEEEKVYSAKVKKRIRREIALRRTVEQDLAKTRQQQQQYAVALRNGASGYTALQVEHDNLQESYYKLLDVSMQTTIEQKTAALQNAKEQGNTAAELQAQSELEELRHNRRQLSSIATDFAAQKAARAQQMQAQPQVQQQRQAPPPPLAVAWLKRNSWIRKPKFAPHREYLKVIDARLTQKGLNPNTPDYYKALDRELHRAFPSKAKEKPQSIVGSVSGGASSAAVRTGGKKTITLTRADLENMRNFGLNPENKSHIIAYAKERAKTQSSAGA